ncbi:deoxycytidylate deaminase [Candidatus Parcubacteria bacterium]|nr:deoxycytidylate deaminase [Candidatus Parcubacteria bacterium]
METNSSFAVVAYVPVLHEGYRAFFERHKDAESLFLFGPEVIADFPVLAKEIRQLDPTLMAEAIRSLRVFERVEVLDKEGIERLVAEKTSLVVPDEDVTRTLVETHFKGNQVTFDSVFLRWDKHNSLKEKPVVPEERISREEFDRRIMEMLGKEAAKSSDIWRHVGAAITKDGKLLMRGHNRHVPSEHMPYVNGDPRSNFSKGDHIEMSTALHAEAGLIAEAARQGAALEGASMYLSVFPCPPCAKLVAYSGIKTLYCAGGYGVLDGEDVLKSQGVKIIFVE